MVLMVHSVFITLLIDIIKFILLLFLGNKIIYNIVLKPILFRFHLVAHDWGGAVSWYFAATYPNMVQVDTDRKIERKIDRKMDRKIDRKKER